MLAQPLAQHSQTRTAESTSHRSFQKSSMERSDEFLPWLQLRGAYGPHQCAYGKGRGHKDVQAVNICSWLLALERGDMIGLHCSDVSGTFDRVSH